MTNTGDNALPEDDQALEELLGRASPRPLPPAEVMRQAKAVVQGEWQQLNRQRTMRRRMTMFATAATVVLAVTVVMNNWLAPVSPVQVATLEKAVGTVYLLGEQSELYVPDDLSVVQSGQTIVTAEKAGVGLSWGQGGSLRLDADTKVMFASIDTVELKSGRVYFDSINGDDGEATLRISTAHGDVLHIGTQFITAVDNDTLTVSVREGEVLIEGRPYEDFTATQGKRAEFTGSRPPVVLDINGFGPEWEWIEVTAPVAAMDGKKLREFIEWVSRETGLKYEFESDDVEKVANDETVLGDISDAPRVALDQSLQTFDLTYDIKSGVIIISQAGH